MQFPNIERQSPRLVATLQRAVVVNNVKFKANINNKVLSMDDLRHRATNYNEISTESYLKPFALELTEYPYALEYLQTFVKTLANSKLAGRILMSKKDDETEYQKLVIERDEQVCALELDVSNLQMNTKSLDARIKALEDQMKAKEALKELAHRENAELKDRIKVLEETIKEQGLTIKANDSKVARLTNQVKQVKEQNSSFREDIKDMKVQHAREVNDLTETVEFHKLELQDQAETIKQQNFNLSRLEEMFIATDTKFGAAVDSWNQTKIELKESNLRIERMVVEHKAELERSNKEWTTRMELSNKEWTARMELALANQAEFFKAEIAEVRGRLDNIEAQMRAMRTDYTAFKEQVESIEPGTVITPELKAALTRDLGNNVALAYATVTNLRLDDPLYEQRKEWFNLLKQLMVSTKPLAKLGFNIKNHLATMNLMLKQNAC